jgi:DNA mismatch repair protein MutL
MIQGQGGIMPRNRGGLPTGPVRRLPGALIDQIAAGEVVERPASVVKELVENALDAGAGRVRVEVRGGGRDWIAVTDDGRGMTPEDARLALERHATSKIGAADDLLAIATYGFRGEALPAIASVSSMRLRTRTADAHAGLEIRARAGRVIDTREAAGPVGTRVEVADLFESVPARRKFLKSANTEWGHIADWLGRAALSLPEVHFDLHRDDRPALAWPATNDDLDRIAAVLGEREAAALVPVRHEEGRATLRGYVSRPDRHRPSLAGVHLFVNRRPVRDRVLQHALVEVYRDVLPRGRFPTAVLFLDVPLEAVDVNVHPAKWEVRFADSQWAHQLVRHGVREAVAQRAWLPTGAPTPVAPAGAGSAPSPARPRPATAPPGTTDWIFASPPGTVGETSRPTSAAPVRFGDQRLLGQLLATYLLLEAKEGLLLVDQHAAHERVLYERLRAEWLERGVERQGLLAPLAVQLEPAALAALVGDLESAHALGFEVERFGEDTVVLRGRRARRTGDQTLGRCRGARPRGRRSRLCDPGLPCGPSQGGPARRARAASAARRPRRDPVGADLSPWPARRGPARDRRDRAALRPALGRLAKRPPVAC